MTTTNPDQPSRVNTQTTHGVGVSKPQNTEGSVKFTLPNQATDLGLLSDEGRVLWQFDDEIGLPVVSSMDYFQKMVGEYGRPKIRENGQTTTLPKTFTKYAHDGGHPQVSFTRDDTLGFFAPESKIANDFPRLYVGTSDDYQRLAQGRTQIIWGEPFERPAFAPSQQKYVREVCISRPGKELFRTTRPASEGWVSSKKLLDQIP